MKTEIKSIGSMFLAAVLLGTCSGAFAATDALSTTLSKGLFEEEANHNLGAAIQEYQKVIDRFDTDRKLAATAVFRLGECYRKQGSTNEAAAQYKRILQEFADQAPLVTLSRQNLTALGGSASTSPEMASGQSSEKTRAPAEAGELNRIQAIIKNSPDLINAPDQSGQTLLQTYAGRGDLGVVKLLLDSGAAVNGIRQPELTPLHYAAGNGHKAVVDLLLSKGARTDVKTESGVTPLHIAVLKGYELVAKDLLDAGAPVDAQIQQDVNRTTSDLSYELHSGQTPLQVACEKGYSSLVELLLAKGADVNANNGAALNAAAGADNEALAKMLLAAKADPKAGGALALKTAARVGDATMLDLLLAHCTEVDLNSLLEEAVKAKRPAAIKDLMAKKADPNANFPGGTPLIFWALSDPATVTALLEGGADPNQRDAGGWSPLERALNAKYEPAVELLLTHGADPNLQNLTFGATPLLQAVSYGNIEAAKFLLEHGAKVNLQNKKGQTPLQYAIIYGHPDIATVLLDHGADPNLSDNNGQTPLDIAKSSNVPVRSYPPPLTRVPGPEPSTTKPVSLADLLRQHGASEDLPHFDRIEVRRFPNYNSTVFSRSTNDLNRFSLLEAIAAHYGFVSATPYPQSRSNFSHDSSHSYLGHSRTLQMSLPFPNLNKIEIRRPKPDGKDWTRIPVSVQSILESGDCSRDVWLQWGDQIEIPEADHPLDQKWSGFSAEVFTNFQNCLSRRVRLTVKGQTTDLPLQIPLPSPPSPPGQMPLPTPLGWMQDFLYAAPQFCLMPALDNSGLMRTSSDLAHVKVTRHNPATGENWERTFDCSGSEGYPDVWLRDGDIVEVPDKP